MKATKSFQDLVAWQKSHEYVLKVYKLTEGFPKHELFGLSAQFRRAAVSIAANIAEGFRKKGVKDKLRFFNIAQGSIEECRYYQILTKDLSYGSDFSLSHILEDSSRLLNYYCIAITQNEINE